ncbi:MAG: histidine phosphatase family protein [Thermoanaerobaculia bacterium]
MSPRCLAVALALAAGLAPAPGSAATIVLLARHAEKLDDDANPNLSPAGLERAEDLADLAERFGVHALYATEVCRTAQTALAVAHRLRMPIAVQPGGGGIEQCTPAVDVPVLFLDPELAAPAALAAALREEHRDRVVLVVGHSNTVPAILRALGGPAFPEVAIGDDEYGRLFIVTLPDGDGEPALVEQRY